MTAPTALTILIVEDDPVYARFLTGILQAQTKLPCSTIPVTSLAEAIQHLRVTPSDIVLLDLTLPDCQGLSTLSTLLSAIPTAPIIVLTGMDDTTIGVQAVQLGAQDYLTKREVHAEILIRSIRHAIERHHLTTELRELSLRDEMTGLLNRRAFYALAEQQLKLASAGRAHVQLIFSDIDNLKKINDKYGHIAGDNAIRNAAEILQKNTDASDIIARIGGDEFVILRVDRPDAPSPDIRAHLQAQFALYNSRHSLPYTLSLSMGLALYDAQAPITLDALIALADSHLLTIKKERKTGRIRPPTRPPESPQTELI